MRCGMAYLNAEPTWDQSGILRVIERVAMNGNWTDKRAFDLGCGHGMVAKRLSQLGFRVSGVDPWAEGIAIANRAMPHLDLHVGSAYDDLASKYGTFPLVISTEVVEHCLEARRFAKTFYELVAPGGIAILSTPYHGYLKNVAISITGKWDSHHNPLDDVVGHVKFFSVRTLRALLNEVGFREVEFERIGRIPPLATSMIAIASKPISRPQT
jgi:SAM-dependent methyltransferase